MEASELKQPHWPEAHALAYEICGCASADQHRNDIAKLLAYRDDAITEDRRSRTFTVSELDKARAEGMERAAVIGRIAQLENRLVDDAIRAAKGANHAK